MLGLKWKDLVFSSAGVSANLEDELVVPIRELASNTIDVRSILGGIFRRGSISQQVQKAYAKHLYGDATLQGAYPAFLDT